ncbi:outer membrane protein [Vibrio ichthyoenteri ATCC 700023]|uniref:Outer membrane protein n=1 Tax=Vibrio ichthyoenteri ATCC 700023 TaxID=870968 RepID=F9RWZ2_9VIBR|nr:OmpA family protein [Vibrio ichthyoenteri]EGU48906.1 outer membrane protein [Vibrio ichthyoenteri ATCC 700023]
MHRVLPTLLIALMSMPFSSVWANESQEIIRYCAKPDLNYQQDIVFGPATQVNMLQGAFMLLQKESDYQLTKQMIHQELLKAGIDPDCAEYLMSKSNTINYQTGELVARVYFAFDKSNLTKESQYVLDTMVEKLGTQGQNLVLEGHTDHIGSHAYNFALGLRRAGSVDNYLVAKQMPKDALQVVSKGETIPIKTNTTAEGRKANRRVDIVAGE